MSIKKIRYKENDYCNKCGHLLLVHANMDCGYRYVGKFDCKRCYACAERAKSKYYYDRVRCSYQKKVMEGVKNGV